MMTGIGMASAVVEAILANPSMAPSYNNLSAEGKAKVLSDMSVVYEAMIKYIKDNGRFQTGIGVTTAKNTGIGFTTTTGTLS